MSKIKLSPHRFASTRTLQMALGAVALFIGFAAYSQGQDSPATKAAQELSRAEVIADLALWRRADMAHNDILSLAYGLETEAYRTAYLEYRRLRDSEEFQIELRKLLSQ